MDLSIPAAQLMGFTLALVRTTAWVTICPPFNSPAIPRRVRVGFAGAVSLLVAARFTAVFEVDVGLGEFVVILLGQMIAGLALGFFVFILFAAIQSAGELIDLQVGFALGAVLDPLTGTAAAPIGRLHQLLAVTVLFAIDGHTLVVRGYLRSVEAMPVATVDLGRIADELLGLFSAFFIAAIEIGLPVLAALFLAEIALGLLGKAAPQMNILILGFAAKSFIAVALLAMMVVAMPDSVDSLLMRSLRAAGRAFGG
ncbi:MAG: flagellar biosynthetic protein FliR [Actinomycetota bacterium]